MEVSDPVESLTVEAVVERESEIISKIEFQLILDPPSRVKMIAIPRFQTSSTSAESSGTFSGTSRNSSTHQIKKPDPVDITLEEAASENASRINAKERNVAQTAAGCSTIEAVESTRARSVRNMEPMSRQQLNEGEPQMVVLARCIGVSSSTVASLDAPLVAPMIKEASAVAPMIEQASPSEVVQPGALEMPENKEDSQSPDSVNQNQNRSTSLLMELVKSENNHPNAGRYLDDQCCSKQENEYSNQGSCSKEHWCSEPGGESMIKVSC